MQSQETTRHDQQAPDEASSAVADPAPKRRGRPPGTKSAKKKTTKKTAKKKATKKKATKKKASKKKAGKKKASKKLTAVPGTKKATRKKASKKKASKKKRGKKKTAARTEGGSPELDRLMAAVEELRSAVIGLATSQAARHSAISDMRKTARAKIAEIEDATTRSLKKMGF
ncbi:MAG: hypothetical protein JJU31_13840 [Wenzhouxiangella sp.]|nr:hypothetical protein [Wenzhouxiangella sp.]